MSAEHSAPTGFERRRAERLPVPPRGFAVSVVGARLVNISGYGMMIESLVPLEHDARMDFRLVIAGEKLDLEARIAAAMIAMMATATTTIPISPTASQFDISADATLGRAKAKATRPIAAQRSASKIQCRSCSRRWLAIRRCWMNRTAGKMSCLGFCRMMRCSTTGIATKAPPRSSERLTKAMLGSEIVGQALDLPACNGAES